MVSDTRYVPRAKNKMDDNNLKKKISKRMKMGNYNSDISSLRRLGRETSLSRHPTPNPPSTTNLKQHLVNEKRKKETKEKNVIQLLMESEKAEIRLEFNRKRKKMTAHTYKAQFKAQRMRTVVSDTDEVIEGPNELAMDKVVDRSPDSVDSENSTSLLRSRDGTVYSETGEKCRDPKDINRVIVRSESLSVAVMDNVVNQPSDGDCLKESCASLSVNKLHTNSSPVKNLNSLEKEASTCSARLQDGVVSESGEKCMHPEGTEATLFPESVNDSLPAICNVCSKRKRVISGSIENDICSCGGAVNKDLCRLSTCKKRVQYSNESPSEPNTDNSDVGNKRRKVVNENVDPESVQVELNEYQGTQGADRERGPSIIATCNQSQSLQRNGVTATSNLNSKQTSIGEISLSDEQKTLYSTLLEELMKLCNILKISEDVTHMGRRFLGYVIKNHHVSSDSLAIVQAFQISLCWIAASISKQTVDKKDSLILAKQHLNYQCTEVNVQSVYSKMRTLKRMYLSEQNLNREPFNEWSAKPADVKKEIGVKSPNEEHGRSEIDIKISEIEKKCRKRRKKLQRKLQEKIQEFHKIWNEKRTQLEDDHRLETAFIRSLHSEVSVRTEKLKHLNEAFTRKIEDHNLELKNLEAEQLAAMNEEKQKAERWLTAAKACYSEPIAANPPPLLESQSTYNAGVSQFAIRTVDATGVVNESTQQLVDQNPGDCESTRHSVGQNPSESESTRHLEDQNPGESGPTQHIENQNPSESESTQNFEVQNPGESVSAHGNASAIATILISATDKAVQCDISTETKNLVDNVSQNEVVVKDIDKSSMEVVEQPNQSKHICDNRELVCSELASGDQSINLTTESPVEVPETAPNENVSQDKVHSSSAELVNQNELVVQNQHDSQVEPPELEPVDTVTAVQSNGELEEGEMQEEEPTMENQGEIQEELLSHEPVCQIDTVQRMTEQPQADAETFESQNASHIEAPISSKELQKGDKWKHTGDHSSDEEAEFSKKPDNHVNNGQQPDNNNQAGKTSNLSDKPSRSRSLTPSPDEKRRTSRPSSPSRIPVLRDVRKSQEENIPSRSPVRSPARKSAQPSDSNHSCDLSRSHSPDGAQKCVRNGRGFTERYVFVRKYHSPSPEPDTSYCYGVRNIQRNNDSYSSYRGRFEHSSQRRYRSPANEDCFKGIHGPASQIGPVHPITEQPQADAEIQEEYELEEGEIQKEASPTMENQGTVTSKTVAIVDHEEEEERTMENQRTVHSETVAIVEPVLITEQPDGNVHILENQVETLQHVNDSLADGQSNVKLQDLVTLALEIESTSEIANSDLVDTVDPAQPIMEQPRADSPTIGNQNASGTEVPISSQTADVVEAEELSQEPASQIEPVQPITEQPQANAETVENTEVPISSQIADVAVTEVLSHEPVSQIDPVQPIREQPQADAETVEIQNASHIKAPISSQNADLAESEVLSHEPVSQIDTVQPITEQPQAETVESRNASLIEVPFSSQIADMAEAEVLSHEPASEIEHVQPNRNTSLIEVPFSSQTSDVAETEALSHEPVSQCEENLEMRSVSGEQIVELGTSSESNEPICESVIGEPELSIGVAVQNGISANYLYGSGYLVPSLDRLSFDPIASELEKTSKEKEKFEKSHANMTAQLKSNCEKEIEEMTYQIKQKYGMKLQVAETEFRHRNNEFEKYLNKLQMNMKLAEASRAKLAHLRPIGHPVNQQGTSQSVYMQQMHHHPSVHPSLRVITTASNFQPSPSHSNASFVGPHIMPHQPLTRPTRYSPITNHSVTAPPVHSVQHMQALFSIPPRPPPVISSITPHNPRVSGEIRIPAPHLQSFRPSVGPTVPPTASPSIIQHRPTFQNGPGPQGGLLAQPGPHPSTMSLREMDPWSRVRANSSSIVSEIRPNHTSLGQSQLGVQGYNVQGNRSSSVVANDVVCLSDDD